VRPAPGERFDLKFWVSNGGFGLDDTAAIALADALERAIDSDYLKYANALSGQESAADRKMLREIRLADGRSLADVAPELIPDVNLIDKIREFAAFLRDSGGFEIW
jgi:hypothetical protein